MNTSTLHPTHVTLPTAGYSRPMSVHTGLKAGECTCQGQCQCDTWLKNFFCWLGCTNLQNPAAADQYL